MSTEEYHFYFFPSKKANGWHIKSVHSMLFNHLTLKKTQSLPKQQQACLNPSGNKSHTPRTGSGARCPHPGPCSFPPSPQTSRRPRYSRDNLKAGREGNGKRRVLHFMKCKARKCTNDKFCTHIWHMGHFQTWSRFNVANTFIYIEWSKAVNINV